MEIEYLLAAPIIAWLLVSLTTVRSIRLLSKPIDLLKEVDNIDSEKFLDEALGFSNWCLENEFSHKTNFLFNGILNGPPIECSAWWSDTTKT